VEAELYALLSWRWTFIDPKAISEKGRMGRQGQGHWYLACSVVLGGRAGVAAGVRNRW